MVYYGVRKERDYMNAESLTLIIRAIRKTHLAAEALSLLSEGNITIVDDAYGDLVDAVFKLCNEQVSELNDSLTYRLIQNNDLSDEQVADMLLAMMKNETASKAS